MVCIDIHRNMLPAFYTLFRNQGKFVKEEVKPHPVLSKYVLTFKLYLFKTTDK